MHIQINTTLTTYLCFIWHPITNNSTLLSAAVIPLYTKSLSLTDDYHSLLHRKMYNCLLADYQSCPIWPLILSLDVHFLLPIRLLLFPVSLAYRDSWYPCSKSHTHIPLLRLFQRIRPSPGSVEHFIRSSSFFLRREVVSASSNP
jgi:hypothetical protein